MSSDRLRGCRILVVEDDFLIAMALERVLQDWGAEVVGPAGNLCDAKKLAATKELSAALLDIQIRDEEVWPAAHILADRGVPFAFHTAHANAGSWPPEWRGRPVLIKPVTPEQLLAAMAELVGDRQVADE